jgi:hypothetical protein
LKKFLLLIPAFYFFIERTNSQDLPPTAEEKMESVAENTEDIDDDDLLQRMEQYAKHPLNLNTASADALKEMGLLNELQIGSLLQYRKILGAFINKYELQAVPYWDLATIRKLLPFICVMEAFTVRDEFSKRFNNGEHRLLLRASQILEKSKGLSNHDNGYIGSPQRVFFRYRYTYKTLLQYGIAAEKDAGEQFFKGVNKGFDSYSFHFFVRKIRAIQSLAIGDFVVNLGQGLIQWQSLAFKKSADVTAIEHQSAVLRPYNSAAEFYFNRGVGITVVKKNISMSAFVSLRKLDANVVRDTLTNTESISSLVTSGNHRTKNEIADRRQLQQKSFGGNIFYAIKGGHVGVNGIYYSFSLPLQKKDEPYNLFAVKGDRWYNGSVDYSYTFKNVHLFGEAAMDKNFHKGFINGILISVDRAVDLSFLYRNIAPAYQAVNGNAFTENATPANEKGWYTAMSYHPAYPWSLNAYIDVYSFPWLKFGIDAPGCGRDILLQFSYKPNKQTECYVRYRNENKETNDDDPSSPTNYPVFAMKQNWRLHFTYKAGTAIALRQRIEIVTYQKGKNKEQGFLSFFDMLYKPPLRPFSAIFRFEYFDTDGYDSRLYAYENDVLYSSSVPALYDKGCRYYFVISYDLTQKLSCWLRFAQTIYPDRQSVGSGLDETPANKRSEIKLQVMRLFN